ncbi:MAG: diphthine--ammonia ligase [Chitinophagaceae bacterium]|nr:diphthine--ammonia ligase [Chitinophagaceae bacterium]
MNWSGGKDSALALWKIQQQQEYYIEWLQTNINTTFNRVSMHGVRFSLLEAQAAAINIPLTTIGLPDQPNMGMYELAMATKMEWFIGQGINHTIFGDIFLEDLRAYREKAFSKSGIETIFPLWKMDTKLLMREFIDSGFKAVVVCVNDQWLDKSFCGRQLDEDFLNDLPSNVDPCGENGEYHSFVFDGPLFQYPVKFEMGEIVYRELKAPAVADMNENSVVQQYGFYFCDLIG